MGLTRREAIEAGLAALAAWAIPAGRARAAAPARIDAPALVFVFLRGGADGIDLVVPRGDDGYYALRGVMAVQPEHTLDLDGFYALHPELTRLLPLQREGHLAVIHAAGLSQRDPSHFGAQEAIERAGSTADDGGWLNRTLSALGATLPWAGVTLGTSDVRGLAGPAPQLMVPSLAQFRVNGDALRTRAFAQLYGGLPEGDLLRDAVGNAFRAVEALATVPRHAPPAPYPDTPFGNALRDAAALLLSGLGVRIVTLGMDGWDMHRAHAFALPPLARELGDGLAAFVADLGSDLERVCVVVMTEFGRTTWHNGAGGTEHGYGSAMFVLGGGLRSGRVLTRDGRWPGLRDAGGESRDLAVTTDYRAVLAAVLERHLGVTDWRRVLPRFERDAGAPDPFRAAG